MSEVQHLREQLIELGFVSLEGREAHEHAAKVLPVEVWVRYVPYALVPIPIRGDGETDDSWHQRLMVANSALYEVFEQEETDFSALPNVDIANQVSSPELETVTEFIDDEDPSFYATDPTLTVESYVPVAVESEEVEPYEDDDPFNFYSNVPYFELDPQSEPDVEPEPEENIVNEENVSYSSNHREVLLAAREKLQAAIADIDALLAIEETNTKGRKPLNDFDPFAPKATEDKDNEKRNRYDDLLIQNEDKPHVKFDPDQAVLHSELPVEELPSAVVPKTQSIAQSESQPQAPDSSLHSKPNNVSDDSASPTPDIKEIRRKANRQRPLSERGTDSLIREVVPETPIKKFRGLTIAVIITIAVLLGLVVAGAVYVFTNKSAPAGSVSLEDASLTAENLTGLPTGFTGKEILELPRLEDLESTLNDEADSFVPQLDFLGEFVSDESPASMAIVDAAGENTPIFTAASSTYRLDDVVLDREQKERLISTANSSLSALGYSEYDPETSQADFDAEQFFVNGTYTDEGGLLKSYSIIVNTAEEGTGSVSGVYITFYAQPVIKNGADEEFKKFVLDSYYATRSEG